MFREEKVVWPSLRVEKDNILLSVFTQGAPGSVFFGTSKGAYRDSPWIHERNTL